MSLTLPYPVFTNGTAATANEVMADMHAASDYLNGSVPAADLQLKRPLSVLQYVGKLRRAAPLNNTAFDNLCTWRVPTATEIWTWKGWAEIDAGSIVLDLYSGASGAGPWNLEGSLTITPAGGWQTATFAGLTFPASTLLQLRQSSVVYTNLNRICSLIRTVNELASS